MGGVNITNSQVCGEVLFFAWVRTAMKISCFAVFCCILTHVHAPWGTAIRVTCVWSDRRTDSETAMNDTLNDMKTSLDERLKEKISLEEEKDYLKETVGKQQGQINQIQAEVSVSYCYSFVPPSRVGIDQRRDDVLRLSVRQCVQHQHSTVSEHT